MRLPRIGFSIGDINGIGLEVIVKSLLKIAYENKFTPIVYGSGKLFSFHKNIVTKNEVNYHMVKTPGQFLDGKLNIVNCWEEQVSVKFGEVNETGGKYAKISLESALEGLKLNHLDALITAPIHKKAIGLAGFNYPGHTELLAKNYPKSESMMLMVSDEVRVGVVTGHIPLKDVAGQLSKELIIKKCEVFLNSLRKDFGIDKPVLAVLGLNPHAGDQGLFGDEEENMIRPAIIELKKSGNIVMGPFPADGFFGSSMFKKFDGVLAMYHDQGLVPFKTIAFGGGVNFTAGLPIIRTSPDHGTGFDLAGKNLASHSSMSQAIYLALDIFKSRKEIEDLTSNQLQKNKIAEDSEDEIIEDND